MEARLERYDTFTVRIEGEGRPTESNFKAGLSAGITLTLGILGSSVLPVPFAFSRTGVLLGLLTALLVAWSNSITGTLLLRGAGYTRQRTFEALADRAAGRAWKLVTQVSLVLLLFGTLCGDYALLADLGNRALQGIFQGAEPAWLTTNQGRVPMVALGLFIVFPLSCLKRIRSLEYAAMAGVGLVLLLAGVIVKSAADAGFPAIASGELPLVDISLNADLPEAVAIMSFAFYVQPMLLPLLTEMPAGKVGVDLTCSAVQWVTMLVANLVYATVGVFAAARYGLSTEGDVLVNSWLPGRWDGVLDGLVAIYLSISMVPMVMTLRYQLDSLITGDAAPYLFRRELLLTMSSLLTSLMVALAFPTAAEKMFAVTGATAVCLVCYILPVVIHLSLYFGDGSAQWRRRGSFCFQPSASLGDLAPLHEGQADGVAWMRQQGEGGAVQSAAAGAAGGASSGQGLQVRVVEAPAGPAEPLLPSSAGGGGENGAAAPAAVSSGGGSPLSPQGGSSQASPTTAAQASQALPMKKLPACRLTDISLDSWLHHSRSRGEGSSGESPAGYGGYESLPYSPPVGSRSSRPSGDSLGRSRRSVDSMGRSAEPALAALQEGGPDAAAEGGDDGAAAPPQAAAQRGQPSPFVQPTAPPTPEQQLAAARLAAAQQSFARLASQSQSSLHEPLLPSSGHSSAAQLAGPRPTLSKLFSMQPERDGVVGYPSVRDLSGQPRYMRVLLVAYHVLIPVFVMLVGTLFSAGALWLSVAALFQQQ